MQTYNAYKYGWKYNQEQAKQELIAKNVHEVLNITILGTLLAVIFTLLINY